MDDVLDTQPPELVVDLLMPVDTDWGDAEYDAFVRTLDDVRDINDLWLYLTPYGVQAWVESAEVY